MSDEEEIAKGSRAAGGCVLAGLVVAALAVVFALSREAGVLALWAAGAGGVYVAARRRMSDSSATPPPEGAAPLDGEHADQSDDNAEGAGTREGMSIIPDPNQPGRWIVAHHYR
ncbi:hypothetical protein [Streptomyces sp. NPDC093093]|uniref:hypothetical protein n=1 Tax=Streptomyces sp. NPDC093093 TaxID=3366025 RepID=UPI0037F53936